MLANNHGSHNQRSLFEKIHTLYRKRGLKTTILKILHEPRKRASLTVADWYVNKFGVNVADEPIDLDGVKKYNYGESDSLVTQCLKGTDHPEALDRYQDHRFEIPQPFVTRIDDGILVGSEENHGSNLPVTTDGYILSTSEWAKQSQKDYVSFLLRYELLHTFRNILQNKNTATNVAPIVGSGSTTYGHWMLQFLPQIEGILDYQKATGEEITFLIHRNHSDWQIEALELIGVPRDQINVWNGEILFCNQLLYPSNPYVPGGLLHDIPRDPDTKIVAPRSYEWIREQTLRSVPSEKYPDKIYVSRGDVEERSDFRNKRQVKNEQEVNAFLSDKGYERVFPADYSIREQIDMFTGADEVVAVDGSGKLNILFSEDVRLLEIFGDRIHPSGFVLASSLGHEYDYIKCPETDDRINVNINKLRKKL